MEAQENLEAPGLSQHSRPRNGLPVFGSRAVNRTLFLHPTTPRYIYFFHQPPLVVHHLHDTVVTFWLSINMSYVAKGEKDYDEAGAPVGSKIHKIRITLTSSNVKNLEKCMLFALRARFSSSFSF